MLPLRAAVASESVDVSLGTNGFETVLLVLEGVAGVGFLVDDWTGFFGWGLDPDDADADMDNDGFAFLTGVPLTESESESSSLSDDV